jgi:hypothetical protein
MEGGYRRRRPRRTRALIGGSKFTDFFKKAHDFIKSKKLVSTVANALGSVGVPYAGTIGNVAGKLGYGRRRRVGRPKKKKVHLILHPGGGLSLPGGAIRRTTRRRKRY